MNTWTSKSISLYQDIDQYLAQLLAIFPDIGDMRNKRPLLPEDIELIEKCFEEQDGTTLARWCKRKGRFPMSVPITSVYLKTGCAEVYVAELLLSLKQEAFIDRMEREADTGKTLNGMFEAVAAQMGVVVDLPEMKSLKRDLNLSYEPDGYVISPNQRLGVIEHKLIASVGNETHKRLESCLGIIQRQDIVPIILLDLLPWIQDWYHKGASKCHRLFRDMIDCGNGYVASAVFLGDILNEI